MRRCLANYTLRIFFSADCLASSVDFDTIQKPGWVATSLAERPMPGVELTPPARLTPTDLATVHDPTYVRAVQCGAPRHLADSSGLAWNAGLWTSVRASNGGAVAAARLALRSDTNAGSLSCGLHHARRDHGAGFCTFNGLALAARAAIDEGATRVVVLDLDAHCGGGTASLVSAWAEVTHVDASKKSVAYARENDSVVLELAAPLAGIQPLDFDAARKGPLFGVTYKYLNGEWQAHVASLSSALTVPENRRLSTPSSKVGIIKSML